MNASVRVARIMGIPIVINASWLITLAFVTSILALDVYPNRIFPPDSPYRDDRVLHWGMALMSGVFFFTSIILHELAHSYVALAQGIPVRSITLFLFGGVSQIAGEAKRPLDEFVMAIVGPLTSAVLAGAFYLLWVMTSGSDSEPYGIVLLWLFYMNLVLAIFNMAPGFPMDGGRVLRSTIWGITGNLLSSTRLATLLSRGIGYAMMALGALTITRVVDYFEPLNGFWFLILGTFLEGSARQSWSQAKALSALSQYRARDVLSTDVLTARIDDEVRHLEERGGKRFLFFVVDRNDSVAGIVTHKEASAPGVDPRASLAHVLVPTAKALVGSPDEDAATLFQRMEEANVWFLPVIENGRVLGVVNRETLLRLFAGRPMSQTGLSTPRA
jgi:Zn-dependent protease